jgi:hypothetical protein
METTDTQNITWNRELEKLLAEEGEKALGASWIHGKCEGYYATRNQWITIPCVVLSTLSGSASIGSQTMFSDAKSASLAIGSVSILVGILQTLGSFWTFAAKQEAHRQADIQWSKLHRFIAVEMTLPRSERIVAKDMLKICRETIERLSETSPLVPDEIIAEFNKKFGTAYPDVAIPDMANGLKKVGVNSPDAMTPKSPLRFSLAKVPTLEENGSNPISRGRSNGVETQQANTVINDVERAEGAPMVGVVSAE